MDISDRMRSLTKSWYLFIITALIIPVLVFCYPFVILFQHIWLRYLRSKHPNLKFSETNNIRTIVDTPRNLGVLHLVIKVNGECDMEMIKSKMIENVLERRNKIGEYCFPYMKSSLVRMGGQYAWSDCESPFDINNHIIYSAGSYRGRPITDGNVQFYLSDVISKFLQVNLPPWQTIIVPIMKSKFQEASSSTTPQFQIDHYFMLTRIHHLLLSDQPNLRISDILLIDSKKPIVPMREDLKRELQESPFISLLKKPIYLPELYSRFLVAITNRWNEFIYRYDPLESPDGYKKKITNIFQLYSILLIAVVTVISDFYKGYHAIQNEPKIKLKYFTNLVRREVRRRNLSWEIVYQCFINSFDPLAIVKAAIKFFWWLSITFIILWPYFVYRELKALRCCLFLGHCGYPNTLTGILFDYTPLIFGAVKELLLYVFMIIKAPKQLYESLFETQNPHRHGLQMASVCGRKVIAWSGRIHKDTLKRFSDKNRCKISEVLLTTLSAALRDSLEECKDGIVPDNVEVTARCIRQEVLLGKMPRSVGVDGLVCLSLPLGKGDSQHLQRMTKYLKVARINNIPLHTITRIETQQAILTNTLPILWVKLLTNYLSKKFCITITDIIDSNPDIKYKTLWGHEVLDAIYFRPPMANTTLSLTLQRFEDHVRLGVISDAELSPSHTNITKFWTKYFENI